METGLIVYPVVGVGRTGSVIESVAVRSPVNVTTCPDIPASHGSAKDTIKGTKAHELSDITGDGIDVYPKPPDNNLTEMTAPFEEE